MSKTTGKETDDSFRLPSATLEQAGLLSAEDKQALEDMKSGTPADDVTHPIVIVDEIRPLKDGHYPLEPAIAAIVSYQQESGVKYERRVSSLLTKQASMKWNPAVPGCCVRFCDPFSLETLREWWWRFRC